MTASWWWLNVLCTIVMVDRLLAIVVSVVCREMPVMPEAVRDRRPAVVPIILAGLTT